ncbi:MAG TPA: PorP/SprF family type IX secretion system membrane protein, partial [Prolixibacteraceae bacterium]|nr:PorP/SprF family type IX secretion system membrane protein [Prolixibacteraceae bacterium]
MKTVVKISCFWFFFLSGFSIAAQDVSFSQFYSNPLYLNPAFAGSVGTPRFGLQYRNQWSGFNNAFTTYSAAFDMAVEKLQGGVGVYVMNDALANNALNSLQINLIYTTFVRLNEIF